MQTLIDHPLLLFVASLVMLSLAGGAGVWLHQKRQALRSDVHDDFGVVLAATLTVLGLLIGFTFSMAVARYDKRISAEEVEANAIGTAYARADLLPTAEATSLRSMLARYLGQRIEFYVTNDEAQLRQIAASTAQSQAEMWKTVSGPAVERPTPVVALAVESINDVLDSQGLAQAAWLDRIPTPAWILMLAIAAMSNMLVGFLSRRAQSELALFAILPLVASVSFFLIADIDSPRGGFINLAPQNLESLAQALAGPPRR